MRKFSPFIALFLLGLLAGCDGNTLSVSPSVSVTGGSDVPGVPGNSSQALPPATNSNSMPVFAHYVTWHRKNTHENSWDTANTIPVNHGCVLPMTELEEPSDCNSMGYDSLDKDVIRRQNQDFMANNIVPLASWWGPAGSQFEKSGDIFLDTYLSVDSPVQIGALYEVTGRLVKTGGGGELYDPAHGGVNDKDGNYDFANPINAERFVNDIRYLDQKYFSNPQYSRRFYRFRGRPVVFIWLTHAFIGDFAAAASTVRNVVSIWCSDFNIMGTVKPDRARIIKGCDVLTSYGTYQGDRMSQYGNHINASYVKQYEEGVGRWSYWLSQNAPEVSLLLPIQFSYLDNRGNPEMDSTPEEARHFAGTVRRILEESGAKCKNILPGLHVTSYNEAYERSSIERWSNERGSLYMDIIREYFSQPLPAPGSCPAGQ